ncbi:MAE_28990/MAE_18760 family HEPN-like nuclease [Baaleninema simplex]|uniref:MAE_28990/MAE_18760 family HEPN-like nuclease n=1 Tax=Baaleninema simplex TaxID=2862350 RepID=UPI0003476E40|nr:MAE_28990/MAE_18760 family HEPN-like nuclease [Baaleninema simplex]
MFDSLLQDLQLNIKVIRAMARTNDSLQKLAFSSKLRRSKELAQTDKYLKKLVEELPADSKYWRVYNHCSTVTRIYAIYENFVEKLISEWLLLLPSLVTEYQDLDNKIQETHREGVGRLLCQPKHRTLLTYKIIRGLFQGVTNTEGYELLPDAFFKRNENLRKQPLGELFKNSGINDSWQWIENNRYVRDFINSLSDDTTLENKLKIFIDYRNSAAHGNPSDILDVDGLVELCNLIESLCKAMVELVVYNILSKKEEINPNIKLGQVIKWFSNKQVAGVEIHYGNLSIGDTVYLVCNQSYKCIKTQIESIQIDKIDQKIVTIQELTQIGLKFTNQEAREKWYIYKINN